MKAKLAFLQLLIFSVSMLGLFSAQAAALTVDITSPATLTTVGASPITVTGTVTGDNVQLSLNGIPVTIVNQTFSASVELKEGFNTVVARATDSNAQQITDSIVISLDLTPPYLTIDSHQDQQIVYNRQIAVTGLVNDIVRGTVEEQQASVVVNGVKATVAMLLKP